MPQTVEVRFKGTRREFYTWADDTEPLRLKEAVVVLLDRGHDLGRVQSAGATAEKKCGSCASCATGEQLEAAKAGGTPVANSDDIEADAEAGATAEAGPPGPANAEAAAHQHPTLPAILRRATQEDLKQSNELRTQEEEVRRQVIQRVRHHKLEMKISDAEWQWDRAKLTVYFTAEKRVDFRALVRELASQFRTRIELRQIGVRDEAARLTGVGRCGREYCCSTWLTDLSPVSLALAKDQHLSLNPSQISGGCGRLLCCLRYEHEFYVSSRKRYPREGKTLTTRIGAEKVIAVDIFRERVFLRGEEGSRIIPLTQLQEELETPGVAAAVLEPPRPRAPEAPRRTERPAGPSRGETAREGSAGPRREPPKRGPDNRPRRPDAPPVEQQHGTTPPPQPKVEARENPEPEQGEDAAADSAQQPNSPARRRRRGRRGRGGSGNKPPSPPTSPEA